MQMTVFGATGPTGRELLAAALAGGHAIRAFTRQPEALDDLAGRIEVCAGDVLDPAAVRRAVEGVEGVFSTLGTGRDLGETTVLSQGTRNILAAMEACGVRRFVGLTTALVALTGKEPFFVRNVVRRLLRHVIEDQKRVEEVVKTSSLDWTIVRPARMIDDDPRDGYRVTRGERIERGTEIGRIDLVRFLLKEAQAREYLHTFVHIAY